MGMFPMMQGGSGGTSALPDVPTADNKLVTANTNYVVQLNNSYSHLYGSHKTSGSCVVELMYITSDGQEVQKTGRILNMPNVSSADVAITVPNDTVAVEIVLSGTGVAAGNTDIWFS